MKKTVLGGILALSVALASCGGPTTPNPSGGTAPAPVLDAPEDATATREFVFSKRQTRAALQSLNLGPQEAVDLGERLRVVLTVSRAKSGANIGKKKATATFIWGNQTVNLSGTYTLGVGRFGTTGALRAADGKLALAVKFPDFQAKSSKSTAYVPDTGEMCARLTFNLGAGTAAWSSNTPVEVCEGTSARDAEKVTLEAFSRGLRYRYQSEGVARWTFARLSDQPAEKLPTDAELLTLLNLPTSSKVTRETLMAFLSRMYMGGGSYKETMQYLKLKNQFDIHYSETTVYHVGMNDNRQLIFILGRNSYGLAGLWTYRFHAPEPDPAYSAAKTYPYLGRYGGSVIGEVQIGPHAAGATVTGRYALRRTSTCSAGAGVTLDKALIQTYVFEPDSRGLTSTKFEIEAVPDDGEDVVMDYAITVAHGGQSKTYTGFKCDIKPPPPPPASVQDVEVSANFERSPYLTTEDGRHEYADLWLGHFDGPTPAWGGQGSQTASGTYRIENAPECGAQGRETLASGPLVFSAHNYVEWYGYSLEVPHRALERITPHSRFVYGVTVTGLDGTRVIEGARCVDWTD